MMRSNRSFRTFEQAMFAAVFAACLPGGAGRAEEMDKLDDKPPTPIAAVPERQAGDVADAAGTINLTDAIALLSWLYLGGERPAPVGCVVQGTQLSADGFAPEFPGGAPGRTADVNGDGQINLVDPVALLNHLFLGGRPPEQMVCVSRGPSEV
jgi:hypothetical protein